MLRERVGFWDSGYGVWDLGRFKDLSSTFLGFEVVASCTVLGFWVQGLGFRVLRPSARVLPVPLMRLIQGLWAVDLNPIPPYIAPINS